MNGGRAVSAALAALLAAAPAHADHIDVAAPAGIGVVAVAADGQCSLREAMLLANGAGVIADCNVVDDAAAELGIELPADAQFTLDDGPYVGLSSAGPNGLPVVSAAYVIHGHGATIRRNPAPATPRFRLLYVDGGSTPGTLTLRNLVLRNGHTPDAAAMAGSLPVNAGGAIYNDGTLTIDACILRNNGTGDGRFNADIAYNSGSGSGGAIYNLGDLSVIDSAFRDNYTADVTYAGQGDTAASGGDGGAIYANYTATTSISGGLFDGNHAGAGGSLGDGSDAGSGGNGGAIASRGSISVYGAAFVGNHAGDGGDADIAGTGGAGGAIYIDYDGGVSLTDTRMTDNRAGDGGSGTSNGGEGGHGGAIAVREGDITIHGLLLEGNHAGDGHGSGVPCGAAGRGGAIAIRPTAGAVTIVSSVLRGNRAGVGAAACTGNGSVGGAIFGNGELGIYDTRIEGNQAGAGGAGVAMQSSGSDLLLHNVSVTGNRSPRGAALLLLDGSATLENTTVAANQADAGEAAVQLGLTADLLRLSYATIRARHGIGIAGPDSVVAVPVVADHSVLIGPAAATACGSGLDTTSSGYNRDNDASCGFTAGSDATLTAPALGPLGDHGGQVLSMLPRVDGGLLDAVPAADCSAGAPSAFDTTVGTRGGTRPMGAGCDIGAAELQATSFWRVLGGYGQHATVGQPFAEALVVQALDRQGQARVAQPVAIVLPATGASASCSALAATDTTGVAQVQCTANGVPGSYRVRIGGNGPFADGSVVITLQNDPDDTIFANGFDGTP